jgi:hypothetical protein
MESSSKHFAEENGADMYTTLLKKKKTHMGSRRSLFMYNPRLTDFYKVLGESKLPPEPFK